MQEESKDDHIEVKQKEYSTDEQVEIALALTERNAYFKLPIARALDPDNVESIFKCMIGGEQHLVNMLEQVECPSCEQMFCGSCVENKSAGKCPNCQEQVAPVKRKFLQDLLGRFQVTCGYESCVVGANLTLNNLALHM
jgi:hypothetical protein